MLDSGQEHVVWLLLSLLYYGSADVVGPLKLSNSVVASCLLGPLQAVDQP